VRGVKVSCLLCTSVRLSACQGKSRVWVGIFFGMGWIETIKTEVGYLSQNLKHKISEPTQPAHVFDVNWWWWWLDSLEEG
jgi:hypothetical protein